MKSKKWYETKFVKWLNKWLDKFFAAEALAVEREYKESVLQAYKRIVKAHEEDLKKVMDVEGEDAYLISEHIREGCTSCPFCFDYDLDFGVVDETHTGVLRQQITCRDHEGCGESWTVEYEASRVRYKNKWYGRYEHWPTFLQTNSPDYKEMLKIRYGLK